MVSFSDIHTYSPRMRMHLSTIIPFQRRDLMRLLNLMTRCVLLHWLHIHLIRISCFSCAVIYVVFVRHRHWISLFVMLTIFAQMFFDQHRIRFRKNYHFVYILKISHRLFIFLYFCLPSILYFFCLTWILHLSICSSLVTNRLIKLGKLIWRQLGRISWMMINKEMWQLIFLLL